MPGSARNGDKFDAPKRMDYPFNSEGDDFAMSFLDDDSGYFSSSRTGSDHIYHFEAIKPRVIVDTIRIIETAKETVNPDLIFAELLKSGKLKYIYFDFDKYNIRQKEITSLIDLIVFMRQYPTVVLELPSYADCRGDNAYNLTLSNKRGEAVKNYLISTGGIEGNRMVIKNMGSTNFVNDCDCTKYSCAESQYELNRRVEYRVLRY